MTVSVQGAKAEAKAAAQSRRTQEILHGNPLPLMLRMAAPNSTAFLVQASVSMTEVWYVGQLGTVSLAAIALVFPGQMLMQMLSGGAFGGAVTGATARALGTHDQERAAHILWHALAIALVAGLVFFSIYSLLGKQLLLALGARGEILHQANQYAAVIFTGCIFIWISSFLGAIYRGMGLMQFPAAMMILAALVQVPLSGGLILGWFGLPQLGLYGAAVSAVAVAALITVLQLVPFLSGAVAIRLQWRTLKLQRKIFTELLQLGSLAAIAPLVTVSTITLVNALLAPFGAATIAGYGIGARLEFLLVPIVFGFGAAMMSMVGMNMGAGQRDRAERIAWIGGGLSALITGIIGISLALFPEAWMGLFTDDPQTLEAGIHFLWYSGPAFAFQGLGLSLYFASQGAGRIGWPVVATCMRFIVGVGGAYSAVLLLGFGRDAVFLCLAAGIVTYGGLTALSIWLGSWRR